MGYKLNAEAYSLLTQIEVGIREFLIDIIKTKGVNEWFNNFLGSNQRDSLKQIVERINNAKKEEKNPEFEDYYVMKLNRALADFNNSYKSKDLMHPFYYLNWNDMENLMSMKINAVLIDDAIGVSNRKVIVENLKNISLLRNDIAHSRFISTSDYQIINGAFLQISVLIPNFNVFIENQSMETTQELLMKSLKKNIFLIDSEDMISLNQIPEVFKNLNECINSFWLLSFRKNLIEHLLKFEIELKEYESLRKIPGGLLGIIKWKKKNIELFINIKKLTDE